MWLGLVAEKDNDPSAEELRKEAYWFRSRANGLIGDLALAISTMTAQWLSKQAEKSGLAHVLLQEIVKTSQCVELITRLLPETKSCWEPSSDSKLGLSYKFKCD